MKEKYTRRKFLKAGFLSTSVVIMNGCDVLSIITLKDTIYLVQNDLFPKARELSIDTKRYMNIVFRHSKISQKNKIFLKNGVRWLNEEAISMFKVEYTKLSSSKRQKVLKSIAKNSWGERWIHNLMTYILEATLSDPLYKSNHSSNGWKWLSFEGGKPSPKSLYL